MAYVSSYLPGGVMAAQETLTLSEVVRIHPGQPFLGNRRQEAGFRAQGSEFRAQGSEEVTSSALWLLISNF